MKEVNASNTGSLKAFYGKMAELMEPARHLPSWWKKSFASNESPSKLVSLA